MPWSWVGGVGGNGQITKEDRLRACGWKGQCLKQATGKEVQTDPGAKSGLPLVFVWSVD